MLKWDLSPPPKVTFDLILSKAKYHIIWGGNYFELPPSRMFLIYDKGGSMYGRTFAECEQAWCSWDGNARIKKLTPPTHNGKEIKQHPTQKPIQIMKWCIEQLPPGCETILDPYLGSGTTLVACAKMGRKGIGIEIDEDYFNIACKRVEEAYKSPDLFIEAAKKAEQIVIEI